MMARNEIQAAARRVEPPQNEPGQRQDVETIASEVADLKRRLEEAEATIRAIQAYEVDAFVVSRGESDQVLTLESADRPYRRYVEAMGEAAVTLSREGTVLYANRAFAQLVARPLDSIVGSSIDEFLAASSRPVLREVIARRPDGRGEALLVRGGGPVVPVHLTASGTGEESEIVYLVITDLTEKRMLAEVTAAESLSRSILEQAVDAIVVADGSGKLIRAGAAARRLCGINPIGLPFEAAFPLCPAPGPGGAGPDPAAAPPSLTDRVLAGEAIRGAEVRLERDDGPPFDLILGAGPLRDAAGHVVGFVATLTDISKLTKAENALREADRRKDEFLAVLAHELRNPLAAIDNAVKVVRQSPADTEVQEWSLSVIERQGQQLGHLVDDLLDTSRISRGKIRLRNELIDVRSVVEVAAQVVQPVMNQKGHTLEIAVPGRPLPVEADPTRLEQILVNLLGNAAKFTDRGGRITLSAVAERGAVVLRVVDNGIGISAEQLPLVFGLFEQVDGSIERSSGGLGIGLTLVKSLAELHGGTVAAESAGLGHGSTFTVRLPRAAAAGTLDVKTTTASPSAPQRRDARILIVDDNVDSVEGLARLLRREGFEVETAHDGPSALEAAALRPPAFVFLDIGLPGLDGYQVAERLRGLLEGAVTICAVSGYGRDEDRKRAQAAGFDHFLIKPIDFNEMMALLAQAGRGA
jgi:PAS domain S-box-containing protein